MPLETGSTSERVMAVARIASTALPPSASICRPACAASGCEVETTFCASSGLRGQGVGFLQSNGVMRESWCLGVNGFEIEHDAAENAAVFQIFEGRVCLLRRAR